MRKVFHVFRESLLYLARSHTIWALVVISFLGIWGLPSLIGEYSLKFYYTLSFVVAMLSFVGLVLPCGVFPGEEKQRTVELLRVKPIGMMAVWLGKWLSYLLVLGGLLAVSIISLALKYGGGIAYDEVKADLPSVEEEVEEYFTELTYGRELSKAEMRELRLDLKNKIPYLMVNVATDDVANLSFKFAHKIDYGKIWKLRFKFDADSIERMGMKARFTFVSGGKKKSVEIDNLTTRENEISLNLDDFAGQNEINVEIANKSAHTGILFEKRGGVVLLSPVTSFWINALRAFLISFFTLAIFSALGLTLGGLFSMPVAIFAAITILLTSSVSLYVTSDEEMLNIDNLVNPSPLVVNSYKVSRAIVNGVSAIARPFEKSPIKSLTSNIYVADGEVVDALLGAIVISLCLAFFASYVLSRKELGE